MFKKKNIKKVNRANIETATVISHDPTQKLVYTNDAPSLVYLEATNIHQFKEYDEKGRLTKEMIVKTFTYND